MIKEFPPYILAFDTANEVVAIGLGILEKTTQTIKLVAAQEIEAHRQSNTQLLPHIDALLKKEGIAKQNMSCIVCGKGPGSFTGVRIALSTAKGVASALEVPLFGVSSLDAVAWNMQERGMRGQVAVVADAMRKEVYPVRYELDDTTIRRLDADNVVKVKEAVSRIEAPWIAGDALKKYSELFESKGSLVDEALWTPTGKGLLLTFEDEWKRGVIDPFSKQQGDPALVLPVYTRLSDAEENERMRLSKNDPKNLQSGVQNQGDLVFRPLDAAHAGMVAALEHQLMGGDAWNEALVLDELPRKDRVWWAAYAQPESLGGGEEQGQQVSFNSNEDKTEELVGYAGGWIIDGRLHILKIGVTSLCQRRGLATHLLTLLSRDARNLGAKDCTLEVRVSNTSAQKFYEAHGFKTVGKRPHYYSNKEDAFILEGPLPVENNGVAGMEIQSQTEKVSEQARDTEVSEQGKDADSDGRRVDQTHDKPWILAIETSCDETAAAVVDGRGSLVSDVLASQIDFHARFGGVVPEIASRKHIEAICGVTQECLDQATNALGVSQLRWRDLSAVAVTFAPGLVGALVVGVAFAKGAAWAADIPFIGVNHLEGHIYANRIETPDIQPPLVVSLVSGGHTMLVHVREWGTYEILGETVDDAVGEAFDKVAKALGLGYPGGPIISKLATQGSSDAIDFPRAMLHSGDLRFSLSGLKTAVITYINKERAAGSELNIPDIAASFQQAVIDVQVAKARTALKQTGAKEFCLGGGVAANPALRAAYKKMCEQEGVRLTLPPFSACTDNAGMIALVALDRYRQKKFFGLDADAHASANLEEPY